jgi:hypothetical protein
VREIIRTLRITGQSLHPNREAEILIEQSFLVLGKEFAHELIQNIQKEISLND